MNQRKLKNEVQGAAIDMLMEMMLESVTDENQKEKLMLLRDAKALSTYIAKSLPMEEGAKATTEKLRAHRAAIAKAREMIESTVKEWADK